MTNTTVRPGKSASRISIVAGTVLLIFGIGFTVLVNVSLAGQDDDTLPFFIFVNLFMAGWLSLTTYMIIYHRRNLKNLDDTALLEIENGEPVATDAKKQTADVVRERLATLELLKNEGSITEDEYKRQREEIVKDI
jgi:hypothetical protein